jgi:hypothetical protein
MTKPGELSLVEETPDFLVWVVSFNKATPGEAART